VVSKKENAYIDLSMLEQMETAAGRKVIVEVRERKIELFTQSPEPYHGSGSKRIVLNRIIELDELFFEGLGLWLGEGGKGKGLYFGNSTSALILRFLKFAEEKLGISRHNFKVTLNMTAVKDENSTVEKWSNALQIPTRNFTRICIDPRISREYAQVYYNGVVVAELMKVLHKKLEVAILTTNKFAIPFLRGIFAAEGSVIMRKSGILHHLNISSKDRKLIEFLKRCLELFEMTSSEYDSRGKNLPIHGWRNFKHFKELGIHTLHPEKYEKFELGFANYKRTNVLDGEEARILILQQLISGPKTYDDLATALRKARTTIQAHHMPILERQGLIKRVGKRGQAWLWAPAEGKSNADANV
jgi:hypothetical protein